MVEKNDDGTVRSLRCVSCGRNPQVISIENRAPWQGDDLSSIPGIPILYVTSCIRSIENSLPSEPRSLFSLPLFFPSVHVDFKYIS